MDETIARRSPLHRAADPITSVLAAHQLSLAECQDIALKASKTLCLLHGDCTAAEIGSYGSQISSHSAETIRKRVHELHRSGLIRLGTRRRCRMSGRTVRTYFVV